MNGFQNVSTNTSAFILIVFIVCIDIILIFQVIVYIFEVTLLRKAWFSKITQTLIK